MAINFQKFHPVQLAIVRQLAKEIDEREELHTIVEYRGGFLPKVTYVAAIKSGRLDMIDVISKTRTGAALARNITILASMGSKNLREIGRHDEAERLRMAAHLAVRFVSEETIHSSYHDWYQACEHVPADLTETEAGMLFAGETLDAMVGQLAGGLDELLKAAQEVSRGTLH